MQLPEQFAAYITQVCDQLRWKKAHPVIQREMEAHLCDQYDAFVKSGLPEDAAVEETLRRTGDAVEIGVGLDRVHRPKPSWGLLILTGILLLTGLAIKLFFTYDSDYPHELPTMLVASVLGIGCLFGAYFMDFTILGKRPVLLYFCALGLMLLLICLNNNVLYNYRIIHVALLFPVVYATLLYRLRGMKYRGLALSLLALVPLSYCFFLVPSSAAALTVTVPGVILLAAAAWGDWFGLGRRRGCVILSIVFLFLLAAFCIQASQSAYLSARIRIAFHPELDPFGKGFNAIAVRELLDASHLIGPGGESIYSSYYTDRDVSFLLARLIYRVGWLVFALIMAVFAAFLGVAIYKCLKQKNMLGKLISLAVILTFAMQILLYILLNTGFHLTGDLCLPLVSYGNTALVLDMALIGVMLSTFRTGSLVRDETSAVRSSKVWLRIKERIHWNDGELTISFKKKMAS